jgi:alkylation response protein AidB-like acyl-CoA dehydrogenase
LAEVAQLVRGSRLLALRAAWSDDDRQAAVACLHAQESMRKVIYDCHQFAGAMGLTLEYPLHFWTYRLKYLQGEAGGKAAHGGLVADLVWRQDSGKAEQRWAQH